MNSWGVITIIGVCVALSIPIIVYYISARDLIFRQRSTEAAKVIAGWGFPEHRVEYFENCIRSVPKNGYVYMTAGELDCTVYTKSVADALRTANKKGVEISVISGPVLSVDENGVSHVAELAKEGIVRLYLAQKRDRKFAGKTHFRVASNGHLYWEEPHNPGEKVFRVGYNYPQDHFEAKRFAKKFKALLSSNEVRRVKSGENPYELFLCLTNEEHDTLRRAIVDEGRDYDDCDIEYLKNVSERVLEH